MDFSIYVTYPYVVVSDYIYFLILAQNEKLIKTLFQRNVTAPRSMAKSTQRYHVAQLWSSELLYPHFQTTGFYTN